MAQGLLYVVATPIGNLGDITARAAATLGEVDFVAAEDTRVTAKLLNHLGLKKPLVSCYRHNEDARAEGIIDRIAAGESCALCCDAGTPAVSDPGEELVRRAAARGVRVVPIPGACAAVTALSACGLSTGRFCFEGFLSVSNKNRAAHLDEIKSERRTLVFYEAPHKLKNTLKDLYSALGEREITLARELTKLHEEIERTTLSKALEEYAGREPRGEYVLIIAGAPETGDEAAPDEGAALELVRGLRGEGLPLSEACRRAAAASGMRKGELYKLALEQERQESGEA